MRQAAGIGLNNFARDSITLAVRSVVRALRQANADAYVGLLAGSVWASQEAEPETGIAASGWYGELTDGQADTRAWVRRGCSTLSWPRPMWRWKTSTAPSRRCWIGGAGSVRRQACRCI